MFDYGINTDLLPEELRGKVILFDTDRSTIEFVCKCKSGVIPRWKYYSYRFLRRFFDFYSLHGLFGMYEMHLLNRDHWIKLVGEHKQSLLDIGAGQGFITENAKGLFDSIYVNEFYTTMVRRLKNKGFKIIEGNLEEDVSHVNDRFDVVSILNVIDVCNKPISLIRNSIKLLKQDGLLIIADPLPFRKYLVYGGKLASEKLPFVTKGGWEESLVKFYEEVLVPLGLEVVTITRLPYLSHSDSREGGYVYYDDMVVVCKRS